MSVCFEWYLRSHMHASLQKMCIRVYLDTFLKHISQTAKVFLSYEGKESMLTCS